MEYCYIWISLWKWGTWNWRVWISI